MRGLQDITKVTRGNHAFSSVSPYKFISEGSLPPSFLDCSKHTRSVVGEGRCELVLSGEIFIGIGIVSHDRN